MTFFTAIFEKWPLLKTLALREVHQQYVGSLLGVVWQIITPLVLITVFWVVFSVGFRVQPASGVPFAVWLTAGMSAWFRIFRNHIRRCAQHHWQCTFGKESRFSGTGAACRKNTCRYF